MTSAEERLCKKIMQRAREEKIKRGNPALKQSISIFSWLHALQGEMTDAAVRLEELIEELSKPDNPSHDGCSECGAEVRTVSICSKCGTVERVD